MMMMIRTPTMFLLLVLQAVGLSQHQATAASSCKETAPFDCPAGTYCNEWNDGCNDCACNDTADVAMCTMKMCPCLETGSCIPTCKDNTACVPKSQADDAAGGGVDASAAADHDTNNNQDQQPVGATNLFSCPEGTFCTNWSDGCNSCRSEGPDQTLAACTEMYCPCYDDGNCEPECISNPECVPAVTSPAAADVMREETVSDNGDAEVVADEDNADSGAAAAGSRTLVWLGGALLASSSACGMLL